MEVAVVGGGPCGLIAAETLATAGVQVTVVEQTSSPGRKLLIAGRGGLNLTHSEPLDTMLTRYRNVAPQLVAAIEAFSPDDVVAWCESLGQPTFVGSSGRIFPTALRATALLRAWLRRLSELDVRILTQHRFSGWDEAGAPVVVGPEGWRSLPADATVLALGGASWARTGSDGRWVALLEALGVSVAPLRPSNCGFGVDWSEPFRSKFAWTPLKNVRMSFDGQWSRGEAMITDTGIEGGAIYALSGPLRQAIDRDGVAVVTIDLHPDLEQRRLEQRLARGRSGDSIVNRLRRVGLSPAAIGLVRELGAAPATLKSVQLPLTSVQPIERAISSAGGLAWDELDENFMIKRLPGVFAAGEMLDWEAPTGGYLLQGCLSTGVAAANGILLYRAAP